MGEAAEHIANPGAAIRGLYAVTPDESDTGVLAARVIAAINGGAKLVQYRSTWRPRPGRARLIFPRADEA